MRAVKVSAYQWVWVVLGLVACAPSGPPPQTPQAEPPVEEVKVQTPKPAVTEDELSRLLATVLPPKAVLSAIPADVRADLDARVARLTAEQKRALLDPDQPFAYQRPLLHLAAGGNAVGAHTALFASAIAADEMAETRHESRQFDDFPGVVLAVAKLAAQHVLVKRAADVAPGRARPKEVLGEIAAAADFLGNDPIYLAALDALAKSHPDPEWAYMRAGALARRLDPAAARAALPSNGAADVKLSRSAETLIAAAEQATVVPKTLDEAVAVARALLVLDRDEDAKATLAPYQGQVGSHLGLAATSLRVQAGSGPCPELEGALGTGGLCRLTWQRFLTPERLAAVKQAWQSGGGRDAESTDVWLGMSHVVPMMYGLQQSPEQALDNLIAFRTDALSAQSVAPHYDGVAQLASTLELGLRASLKPSDGSTPQIPKAERGALIKGAERVLTKSPEETWSQAAALGTIAVLLPHEDSNAVLVGMSERIRPEWRITHASLLLWNLLANGATREFVAHKGLLGRAAETSAEGSYARSRWVILWAEAEAHLEPSDKTYRIVTELAERLNSEQVPLDLRLRTALDVAGLKARQGDIQGAIEVLGPLVANTPRSAVTNRLDQELLIAASGYASVLRALASEGEEQRTHIQALAQLVDNVAQAAAAPPVLLMWLVLWKGELDALVAKTTCAGKLACEQRAAKLRGIGTPQFEKVVGTRMAAMLRRGVLPIGGVDLELRYRGGRLAPHVDVDPAFLLVHMPTLDGKTAPAAR